jgi:hypothetical protein
MRIFALTPTYHRVIRDYVLNSGQLTGATPNSLGVFKNRRPSIQDAVMTLETKHIEAFERAEFLLFHSDFCPYFELRSLFKSRRQADPERFRSLFVSFYDMNTARLPPAFLDCFFAILFSNNVMVDGRPDVAGILSRLYEIDWAERRPSMQFSFVSKLAAMHDESSPVYDSFVGDFFSNWPPSTDQPKAKRIDGFLKILERIKTSYTAWSNDHRLIPILERFKQGRKMRR